MSQFCASDQRPALPGELTVVLDRGGGWLGCAGQVGYLCESEPQRLPGRRVTIHKVWEQTFRAALYKMDTANLLLAMPGLFSGLAWLSCLLPLSDVGAALLDWAGNRV